MNGKFGTISHVLRCRVIGEACGDVMVWGFELYVADAQGERSCWRELGITDQGEKMVDFCRRVNDGAVSPVHARDIVQDFRQSLVTG